MASVPNRSHGSFWEVQDDMELAFQVCGSQLDRSPSSMSPLGRQQHAYSNEALVDGDEYFSDQMEYEEPTNHRRSRERPLGASPVHRSQADAEQRRLMGKSMPQLTENVQISGPGRPSRQHRYEVIPPGPPRYSGSPPAAPAPAPLPPRPAKAAQTPTPPRRSAPAPTSTTPRRTPSNASQVRRQGSIPRTAQGTPLTATSHPKMAMFLANTSITPRRNLTPLMNSMSPHRSSERRPSARPQQYSHRRSLSMSSSSSKLKTTAIVAPSTYKSYDLEGFAHDSPHRVQTELEADMAELHAALMASPSRWSHSAPNSARKAMSGNSGAHMTSAVTVASSPLTLDSSSPASSKMRSSWVRLPGGGWAKRPSGTVSGILLTAGFLLLICGLAAGVMCFYLLAQKGRTYYLDLGVLASFTSVMLGAFGLRARASGKMPNRNYVTAYLLLTTFAILSVAGLSAILVAPPPTWVGVNATITGTPLVDVAGGAVCATSAMTLLLTTTGFFVAYCSNYPPPDNRVGSCSPGFRV